MLLIIGVTIILWIEVLSCVKKLFWQTKLLLRLSTSDHYRRVMMAGGINGLDPKYLKAHFSFSFLGD